MLTLAFDTATNVATSALVWDDEVLAELTSRPVSVLEDVDALFRQGGVRPAQLEALVVGTGPGSFTSLRMGIATARALSFALEVPVAGVSTLRALEAGAPGSLPIVDARRSEVFVLDGEPKVAAALGPRRRRTPVRRRRRGPLPVGARSRRGARSRPTTTSGTCRARGFTSSWPTTMGLQSSSSRSIFESRTRSGVAHEDEAGAEDSRAAAPRPAVDRAHRARLVRDALVAVDVRGRALEAVVGLPRRVRREDAQADRLPDRVALRRRMARDEHRGRARHDVAAARRR